MILQVERSMQIVAYTQQTRDADSSAGLIVDRRRRRRANINPTLGLMSAEFVTFWSIMHIWIKGKIIPKIVNDVWNSTTTTWDELIEGYVFADIA